MATVAKGARAAKTAKAQLSFQQNICPYHVLWLSFSVTLVASSTCVGETTPSDPSVGPEVLRYSAEAKGLEGAGVDGDSDAEMQISLSMFFCIYIYKQFGHDFRMYSSSTPSKAFKNWIIKRYQECGSESPKHKHLAGISGSNASGEKVHFMCCSSCFMYWLMWRCWPAKSHSFPGSTKPLTSRTTGPLASIHLPGLLRKPAWRSRVIRAKANGGRGTMKGKRSVGKFGQAQSSFDPSAGWGLAFFVHIPHFPTFHCNYGLRPAPAMPGQEVGREG